jgi:hypothetical protein
MLFKLVIALLIVAVFVGAVFGYRAYSRKRDLAETLEWMSQTYNPRENGWGGHGRAHGECALGCQDLPLGIFSTEVLSYSGCQITTVTTSNRNGDLRLHETFNLRDIDTQSIQLASKPQLGGVAEVQFATRNNAEALFYTGNINGKGARSEFMMDDAAYASRFAKAFKHAVDLCGGQPSKF